MCVLRRDSVAKVSINLTRLQGVAPDVSKLLAEFTASIVRVSTNKIKSNQESPRGSEEALIGTRLQGVARREFNFGVNR